MNLLIPFQEAVRVKPELLGNKALTLARLQTAGYRVPEGFCLPVGVYWNYLSETGLADFILMELERKDFSEMRWEEIWDVSLRIRNHFVTASWPENLERDLLEDLNHLPQNWSSAAVRSTAPGEDSENLSFAGLHESRIMVSGSQAILDAIQLTWASLWSDSALLYRQELGLNPLKTGMAVLVQEMVVGERSGILFTQSPNNNDRMMIESVWGLNQALVDGTLEPDRWQISRRDGRVCEKHLVRHLEALRPVDNSFALVPISPSVVGRSPLDETICEWLFEKGQQLEAFFSAPVDVEWTVQDRHLYILQARPITKGFQAGPNDNRPWYLTLHPSLETLEQLSVELEEQVIPGMHQDAQQMVECDLAKLSNAQLVQETLHRRNILEKWLQVYKEKCIPMAHGMRLFGQFYNDCFGPDDPYEFLNLLRSENLLAVKRNRQLLNMAQMLREDPRLLNNIKQGHQIPQQHPLYQRIKDFADEYSGINWVMQKEFDLWPWLIKLAEEDDLETVLSSEIAITDNIFKNLSDDKRTIADRLLDIARRSYALRDNDNLYLGKVRAQVVAAEKEVRRRVHSSGDDSLDNLLEKSLVSEMLFKHQSQPQTKTPQEFSGAQLERQLIGQPAGPGFSSGKARILQNQSSLTEFQKGEVLVCDAIEPNMTFVVPLAVAIIERRGGMLIHGAIIAREYGIPCVTGISEATRIIQTGDIVTVDGHLGIVTIDRQKKS